MPRGVYIRTEECLTKIRENQKKAVESNIGKHSSEETKKKQSNAHKGNKSHLGKPCSEERKQKISNTMKGKYCGKDSWMWKGGKKLTNMRHHNKRRELGFNPVNEPISDDEVAHHLTEEFVAYVPEYINKSVAHNIYTGKNMDEVNFYALNYLFLVYNKKE